MSNVFDENANSYDEWFRVNDKLFDSEYDAIASSLEPNIEYVEIGVGTGLFASRLGIAEGIEPSSEMAVYAKKRGINVSSGEAQNLPYDNSSIEGLLMVTVDCFIKDIKPVFSEAYRVLQPGGSYIMAFLDRGSPLGECYEANKENDIYYKDATFRSYIEMKALLEDAHFEVLGVKNTVFTLDNINQPWKDGNGEGVFAVIKAKKEI